VTVREAFHNAGYPVPEGPLYYASTWWVPASFYSELYTFTPTGDRWVYLEMHWADPFGHTANFDLSNLPAIDAYDALPEVVRKVVKP
jgi:hypothetical protein